MESSISTIGAVNGGFLAQTFGVTNSEVNDLFLKVAFYLALDDTDALLAGMATAVSVVDPDDPLWLMIVGPSSGSKTEQIRMLVALTDDRIGDITRAGLLAQRGKGAKTGLLVRLGDNCNAFVTISDMSSLLSRGGGAMSGQEQSGVYEALRDIYDGHYSRMMDQVNPEWAGKVTFLAAATPAIDNARSHTDALGTRWIYFRMNQLDGPQRKAVTSLVVSRVGLKEHREAVAKETTRLVEAARLRLSGVEVSDATTDIVESCALLATFGRVIVPRDTYRRTIDGIPHWEEPGRMTHQLMKLARSLTALELGEAAVQRVVRRAAVSCIPPARLEALRPLLSGEWLTIGDVARAVSKNYKVMEWALQDWEAVGIVEMVVNKPADAPDEGEDGKNTWPRQWRIAEDQRQLVSACLSTHWTIA